MTISINKIKEKILYILPTLSIISQWITIINIKLSWIIYGFLLLIILSKPNKLLEKFPLLLFSLLLLISPFITFLLGRAFTFNFTLYSGIATGVIFFLYISILEKNEFRCFINGCLISCIIFSIWGVYEIFTGNYILTKHDFFTQHLTWNGMHYPIVAFPNTNDISQYLTILFPISAIYVIKKNKPLIIAFAILIFYIIYSSASRLCMITYLGIWLISLFIFLISRKRLTSLLKVILILCITSFVIVILDLKTGIVSKVLDQFLIIDVNSDYFYGREVLYKNILEMSYKLPFGGFGTAYIVNEMPPHNFLLFILCDYGWFFALLFIVMFFKFSLSFYRYSLIKYDDIYIVIMLSTFILFPILSSVSSTNEQRKIIWIALGIFVNQYLQIINYNKTITYKDNQWSYS